MVLRGATSLLGALEGVGSENLYFFGPNGTRFARAISGPKKVSIFGAHSFHLPMPLVMMLHPSKPLLTAP
jgi:hypothetical protein